GVRACGRAGVRACGRAGVRACGRAGVRACGRAGVRACGRWGEVCVLVLNRPSLIAAIYTIKRKNMQGVR
ncbi:MAG: hypothetical protein LBK00_03175, partial [Treponema sp.]|nr:hypothetical protein [Treponema sp.]